MFEKNLNIGYLLDFYGELLSERKRSVMDMYYNEDLSLAEIAEHTGLSRQGVRYAIKHAEEALLNYEEKLGLSKKTELLLEKLFEAEKIAKTLKANHTNESNEFDRLLSLISSAGSIMKE